MTTQHQHKQKNTTLLRHELPRQPLGDSEVMTHSSPVGKTAGYALRYAVFPPFLPFPLFTHVLSRLLVCVSTCRRPLPTPQSSGTLFVACVVVSFPHHPHSLSVSLPLSLSLSHNRRSSIDSADD